MNTPAKLQGPIQAPAETVTRLATFKYTDPTAERIYLTGDFNHWNPNTHLMLRRADGSWQLEIPLPAGSHRYRFLVDGRPTLDPLCSGVARNEKGEEVSVFTVP